MATGPSGPAHTENSSSGVSTPKRRHTFTSASYRATPRNATGSEGRVHSSWLPGVQITRANRLASVARTYPTSAKISPTSPATISQSSGSDGRRPSSKPRFSGYPTCRSLIARSRPATSDQPSQRRLLLPGGKQRLLAERRQPRVGSRNPSVGEQQQHPHRSPHGRAGLRVPARPLHPAVAAGKPDQPLAVGIRGVQVQRLPGR